MKSLNITDPLFEYENFFTLPVSFVVQSIGRAFDKHRRLVNIEATPLAILTNAALGYMGAKDLEVVQFLPYTIDTEESLKPSTCRAFLDLYDSGLIPEKVLNNCIKYISIINKYDN